MPVRRSSATKTLPAMDADQKALFDAIVKNADEMLAGFVEGSTVDVNVFGLAPLDSNDLPYIHVNVRAAVIAAYAGEDGFSVEYKQSYDRTSGTIMKFVFS
jgi:hypothetical protein